MKLAVAFDQENRNSFFSALDLFENQKIIVKVGMRLFPHLNTEDYENIKKRGFELFVDAKLHDIPSQVESSVRAWALRGADYLTIHCLGGQAMIQSSLRASEGSKMKVLGVTLLTSMGAEDLNSWGLSVDPKEFAKNRMLQAQKWGLNAFVCAASEADELKKEAASEPFLVCPGVSINEEEKAVDQKRVLSLDQALLGSADVLVLGRAIWNAKDPCLQLTKILDKMNS